MQWMLQTPDFRWGEKAWICYWNRVFSTKFKKESK